MSITNTKQIINSQQCSSVDKTRRPEDKMTCTNDISNKRTQPKDKSHKVINRVYKSKGKKDSRKRTKEQIRILERYYE